MKLCLQCENGLAKTNVFNCILAKLLGGQVMDDGSLE